MTKSGSFGQSATLHIQHKADGGLHHAADTHDAHSQSPTAPDTGFCFFCSHTQAALFAFAVMLLFSITAFVDPPRIDPPQRFFPAPTRAILSLRAPPRSVNTIVSFPAL
jgi:hypothetical protein